MAGVDDPDLLVDGQGLIGATCRPDEREDRRDSLAMATWANASPPVTVDMPAASYPAGPKGATFPTETESQLKVDERRLRVLPHRPAASGRRSTPRSRSMDQLLDERFRVYLRGLPLEELRQLAFEYSQAAFDTGLKVLKPDGTYRAIPPALTPAVENGDSFIARSTLSRHLLSGLTKAAAYFLGGPGKAEADQVFAGLAPWERQLLDRTWQYGHQVAIARADFFTDSDGTDRPLEMNSTIPAMPGYGDIIAQAFLAQIGRRAGLNPQEIEDLRRRNGRNVDDLRRSLLAHLERLGSTVSRPTVAVVARPQDAQSAELAYICRELNAEGMVAYRCTPDQIAFDDAHRPDLAESSPRSHLPPRLRPQCDGGKRVRRDAAGARALPDHEPAKLSARDEVPLRRALRGQRRPGPLGRFPPGPLRGQRSPANPVEPQAAIKPTTGFDRQQSRAGSRWVLRGTRRGAGAQAQLGVRGHERLAGR